MAMSSFRRRRFEIQDNEGWNFNVTDTTTGTTTQLNYFYVNQTSSSNFRTWTNDTAGADTWNYAPISEMSEVDNRRFGQLRERLHQDDDFVAEQLREQARLVTDPTAFELGPDHLTPRQRRLRREGMRRRMRRTARMRNWIRTQRLHAVAHQAEAQFRLERADFEGIEVVDLYPTLMERFTLSSQFKAEIAQKRQELKAKQLQKERAKAKSLELLQKWLTPNEYKDLMDDGVLKLQSGDETFEIKRNPGATVKVVDKKGRTRGNFCLISKEMGYAMGDLLLMKIMMIKTEPNNFKKIAINRGM